MDFRKYGLGCFKDVPDERDFIFTISKAASPVSYPSNFKLESVPIKNQGSVNSCVAHSIATIKEVQEYYETKKKMTFSVGWIYGYRVGNQYKGEGMYPREALNNLIKYGEVTSNYFPENIEWGKQLSDLISKRKTTCLTQGLVYRCSAYARVTGTQNVKACLYVNHSPVLICCNIYDSFYTTKKDGVVPTLMTGQHNGNHAMVIVGWKKIGNAEYWIVQNSWGVEFADNGYCYIRVGSRFITDMYTVTDMKNVR